jgi:ESCRT-I complex subunit VPS28
MVDRVELWTTAAQRAEFEDLAELYAILKTTELLETAYARDALDVNEYREACTKLITQFKNTEKALIQRGTIENLQQFIRRYAVDCPRGVERMSVGAPDSVGGTNGSDDRRQNLALVREMTELFIYLANLLSLGRTAADELTPQLEALLKSLAKAKNMIQGFDMSSLEKWLRTLQQMRASDQLDEEQTRQFMYDLNSAKAQIDDLLNQG